MGYLEINSLQNHFLHLEVSYTDDIIAKYYCDTYKLAKVIKQYNEIPRFQLVVKY